MCIFARRSVAALLVVLLLPAAAFAQAAITGVVRDTSGAVLPGVTVEAASPVLIERTRSVVSDDTGQYRIVDLRPGTYAVTFALPGFNTVKREGIELSGDFVATISVELRVGALEETVTVTGESPIVDVQSARVQTIIDRDVIAAIPSSRNATGIQSLVPGLSSNGDSGGITGGTGGTAGNIHGARASDSRTLHDGINTGWAGANSNAAISNVAGSQEVVLTTSGGLGEAETAGVILNVIPRDGGNTFSGTFFMSGANGSMQGSNYTQELKDAGLRSPQELRKVFEFNPMGGGRIVRDKLWFYVTYRSLSAENTVPGMFFNRNAGDPTKWVVDFDTSRPAYNDNIDWNAIGRITWQISPRNKFSLSHSQQYSRRNAEGGGQATRTPEAVGLTLYTPGFIQTATWASPFTNRLLFEAGWADYFAKYANSAPRIDGSNPNTMISVVEQCSNATLCPQFGGIPNLVYRLHQPLQQGFENHQIGTIAQMRASASYIPGSHSLKFGYQGNISHPSQSYFNFTPFIQYRFNNGVPNQLTQTAIFPGTVKYQRNILMTSFYAQDTYTRARLTLQGGIRYDGIGTGYPDAGVGGPDYQLMPTRIFYAAGTTDEIHWKDITPRVGAAYDLFGNGKTAIKVNVGKYLTALTASNSDLDLNPLIRTTPQTTRTWNDSFYPVGDPRRGNYVPDCDLRAAGANLECGAMDNQNFGKEIFTKSFDPDLIHGWGKRTYNWEMGVLAAAGAGTPRRADRWLLPPLVRQLLHREQPPDDDGRLHAVQHPDSSGSAAAGRWRRHGDRPVQPGAGQGRPGGPVLAALLELRRDDRELARHRRQRQRAAAQRSDRSRRHEHRPSAAGQLRRASGAAGNLQLGRAPTAVQTTRVTHVDRRVGQPVVPRRGAIPDLVPRPGHLHRAQDRCERQRHVAERPGTASSRLTTS